MSKLIADITWKHRNNFNSFVTPITIINDVNNSKKNEEINLEIQENLEENLENENETEENEVEENDNVINSEEKFDNYLQGWAEMLEQETLRFQDENDNEMEEFVETNNIIHPAIDSDAKWNLNSIFKELEFPF